MTPEERIDKLLVKTGKGTPTQQLSREQQLAILTRVWEDKPLEDDPKNSGDWQFG